MKQTSRVMRVMGCIPMSLPYCACLLLLLFSSACRRNPHATVTKNEDNTRTEIRPRVTVPEFVLGAYLPYWGIPDYQAYAYEDINTLYIITTISQATVLQNKGLIWGDNDAAPNAYQQPDVTAMLAHIRTRNPDIRILLALSDLHNDDTQRAATAQLFNATNRAQTIQYLMREYVDKFDFDGVDIDFEDTSLDPGYIGSNYPLFIRDLSAALHDSVARSRRKLSTVTLGLYDYLRSNINQDVYSNVDLLGPQDYGREKMDYLLAEPPRDLSATSATWATKIAKSKLVFGIGMWTQYANASGTGAGDGMNYEAMLKMLPQDTTFTPWLTTYMYTPGKPSGYVQRYNSLYETRRKAEFLKAGQFRGLFTWDITKDARESAYAKYSLLKMLKDWSLHPQNYPPIKGFTRQDYYSSAQPIVGGFHSLPASAQNWVGVYEFKTGNSTGYYQYLPNSASGSFTIPASLVQTLSANKLYILRFYNGANGIGNTFHGTSHPFYKL